MVAIKSVLPPGADVEAMFREIEDAAAWFDQPVRGGIVRQRDWLQRRIDLTKYLIAMLGDEPRTAAILSSQRERDERRLALYAGIAQWQSRHPVRRELLYGELLRIWVEHSGTLGVSGETETGGPCARYLIKAVQEIAGKTLKPAGVREIINRWSSPASGNFLGGGLVNR
jgi:hypothetical protein